MNNIERDGSFTGHAGCCGAGQLAGAAAACTGITFPASALQRLERIPLQPRTAAGRAAVFTQCEFLFLFLCRFFPSLAP